MDNFAEKVNICPLNRGLYVLFVYNWERENCSGVFAIQGFLMH